MNDEPASRPLAAGAALVLFLPLSSAGNLEHVPFVLPLALALLVALSAWRPAVGLVALSASIPVSQWMGRVVELHALRMAEALVLAVLTGALVGLALDPGKRSARGSAVPPGVWLAAWLLAAAAGASVAVEWCLARAAVPVTLSVVTDSIRSVSASYLYRTAAPSPGLVDAARLVEGVGLLVLILGCSRRHPELPRRLAVASLAGAAGAAMLNLCVMVADVVTATGDPWVDTLVWYLSGRPRLAVHVADPNAAGSYFLMMTLTGVGLAAGGRRAAARACGLSSLAIGAALWLAGSRAAVAAALLVGLGTAAWWIRKRWPMLRLRTVLAGVVLAAVVLPISIVSAYPARNGIDGAVTSARIRVEFVATSLRMWSTEPLFGVGSGRYYDLSDQFMGPALDPLWRENAHNNFLQIGAELGAVGFVGFAWLLLAGGRRVREALRNRPRSPEPLLIGAGAGVAAYLVTCLAGHPLLVPETAYPFWIMGGLVVALAHRGLPSSTVPGRRCLVAGPAIGLFLLATVPFRIDAAVRDAALRQDSRFGAFDWELDPAGGRRFRWLGPRATFFVPGGDGAVRVPLRALHARLDRPVRVDVAVGGQRIARLPLIRGDWVHLALSLPESGGWRGLHRLDLTVDPPWRADERRNGDARTLGVQVGRIEVPPSGQQ